MSGRNAQDLWHLTIDDLFSAPVETPRLDGPGPFVINLSASTAPISVPAKTLIGFEQCRVFQVTSKEEGRERFRLRLGFFSSVENVEKAVEALRSRYPSAFATQATPDDLRFIPKSGSAQIRSRVRTDGVRKIGKKRDVRRDHAQERIAHKSSQPSQSAQKHSGANNLTAKQQEALDVESILLAALAEPSARKPRKPGTPPHHSAAQSKHSRARRHAAPVASPKTSKGNGQLPATPPALPKAAPVAAKPTAPQANKIEETAIDLHLVDRIFEAPASAPAAPPAMELDDTARAALDLLTKPRAASAAPDAPTPAKSLPPEEIPIDLQMVGRMLEPAAAPAPVVAQLAAPTPPSAQSQTVQVAAPVSSANATGKNRRPEEVPIDLDFVDTIIERIRGPLAPPAAPVAEDVSASPASRG